VARALYRWWSALLFLLVILQVAFAGYGVFFVANDVYDGASVDEERFEDGFGLHAGFGFIVILAGLIFMAIGIWAGLGRWRLGRHGLLALLLVLQLFLPELGRQTAALGFLHVLDALLIFTVAGWIAWDEWKSSRMVGRAPAV
jgi:hypothetical protein